jgi:hypothetical protein
VNQVGKKDNILAASDCYVRTGSGWNVVLQPTHQMLALDLESGSIKTRFVVLYQVRDETRALL